MSENNRQLFRYGDKIGWIADVPGSDEKYLALFYTGDQIFAELTLKLSDMGLKSECSVRDLWNRKEMGTVSSEIKITLPAHGSALYKLK